MKTDFHFPHFNNKETVVQGVEPFAQANGWLGLNSGRLFAEITFSP
jgi:hypothetical protein